MAAARRFAGGQRPGQGAASQQFGIGIDRAALGSNIDFGQLQLIFSQDGAGRQG